MAANLPNRKFTSVWSRIYRLTHPGNLKGAWSAEEDSTLLTEYARHGAKWKCIGDAIGRLPESCRDRWRAIGEQPGKQVGTWSEEEEAALSFAVNEYLATAPKVRLSFVTDDFSSFQADTVLKATWGACAGYRPQAVPLARWGRLGCDRQSSHHARQKTVHVQVVLATSPEHDRGTGVGQGR